MENQEANKRIFPRDNNLPDEQSQEYYEKKNIEELLEPKEAGENDENQLDAKNSESKEPDSYPQTSFTAWNKHLIGFDECNRESKIQMAEATLNPFVFPALAATTETGWNYIRHGFYEHENELKQMDDLISEIWEIAYQVGDAKINNKQVGLSEIKQGLIKSRLVWRMIFEKIDKIGFSIRLKKTPKWELQLEKKLRKDRSRSNLIVANETDLKPITKKEVDNNGKTH